MLSGDEGIDVETLEKVEKEDERPRGGCYFEES